MSSERKNINQELQSLGAGRLKKTSDNVDQFDQQYFDHFKQKMLSEIEQSSENKTRSLPIKNWLIGTSIAAILVLGILIFKPTNNSDLFVQVSPLEAMFYLNLYDEDFDEFDAAGSNGNLFSDVSFDKEFIENYLFND
jgi:hypothetical protein